MNLKAFFLKNWQHFAAIGFIFILAAVFYQPVMDGQRLKQHDIEQAKGMSSEIQYYKETVGESPLWTNSMFGGMPATQISLQNKGNVIQQIRGWFTRSFPGPMGILLLHLIGFYIFGLFLRMKPLVALFGAIAFSFASYEIIIVQAGHVFKSYATAFMAPVVGSMIYAYRGKWVLGSLFMALFMSFELAANHFQITYYLMFPMVAIGIYLLVEAFKKKELKKFFISTAGIGVAIAVAFILNIGNLLMTYDYAKHTIRGANDLTVQPNGEPVKQSASGGLEKEYLTQWSYGVSESFTLLSPNVMGGSSFPIENGPFEEIVDASDFKVSEQKRLKNLSPYWGDQPMVAGPTYLGIIVVFLAFLALFFSRNKLKWPLLAAALLALFLAWGKNFMGLTDWFIENFPMYNKFRAPSMMMVLVEMCVAMLAMLFLVEIGKRRKELLEKKTMLLAALGGFFLVLLIIKFAGIGNYTSPGDQRQLDRVEASYRNQIVSADPQTMMQNYNLNINDPMQVEQFVGMQMEPIVDDFNNLKSIREDIFHSSMNRSLGITFVGIILLVVLAFTSVPSWVVTGGFVALVLFDLLPIAHDYIGEEKYWIPAEERMYPIAVNSGDLQILEMEMKQNPELSAVIKQAEKDAKDYLNDHPEIESRTARMNVQNKFKFGALNMNTHYRVFDLSGGFSSSRSSYYHKAIGGYHGAKLRNFANVIDFHLSSMNANVYDMLNTKYFIQAQQDGSMAAIDRKTALGNAWLIKEVSSFEEPIDEIRALGNTFKVEKKGNGTLFINGEAKNEANLQGRENIIYLTPQGDSLEVQLRAGLREGEVVSFVKDANGSVNYVPAFVLEQDTLGSFENLVSYSVEDAFDPKTEAVMLKSEASKLSAQKFSGEGTISLDEYAPSKLTYSVDAKEAQFAVFSEIYYPDWKAYVDGKEVEIIKTNYLLRGLEIPAGKHKIEFVYDQPIYHTSNTLALVMSLLIIGAFIAYFVIMFVRKRKAPQPEAAE